MTLSLIGAGFGRTGTNSLKLALEQIGFGPCHHMVEVFINPKSAAHWQQALDGQPMDWEAVMAGYKSLVDWPGALFWRELWKASPKAKILLSVRDEESWFKSITNTIFVARSDPATHEDPVARDMARMVNELVDRAIGSTERDRDTVLAAYRKNIAEVKEEVQAEQLLVFDVKQGWAPLCEFLEVAVPDTPFPRTNSTDEFVARLNTRNAPKKP
ncbi:MAG: sulfotransferase family protein [Rhodobiaceae bacterium]|nr:MAG: sulfotransferase family protein [Rhodobiaceae bacterium]